MSFLLQKATSSRRPFDTVAPLGVQLGMDPQMGERTGSRGENVFDAKIRRDDIDVSPWLLPQDGQPATTG